MSSEVEATKQSERYKALKVSCPDKIQSVIFNPQTVIIFQKNSS